VEHNFERLKAHILPLSRSGIFEVARTEWDLVSVEITEEFEKKGVRGNVFLLG